MKAKVQNLTSDRSGRAAANHFEICTADGRYFQSYNSIIVYIDNSDQVWVDEDNWNYSNTTSKYRNQFLGESTEETMAKIRSGEYKLINLN
jgi:hypothetical protein